MHHLVGTAEIAAMLHVSRQRVHQLTSMPTFPTPVAVLSAGTIWERVAVEAWIERRALDQPITREQPPDDSED